jgi:hypothetical protein
VVKQDYVGTKVSSKRYYLPKAAGAEESKVSLWASLRKIIRGK